MTVCIKCGGEKFESDPVTGESCCISCGTVSSVANLVAEVEFVETGSSSRAVGKFVGTNDDPSAQVLKPSQEFSVNRVRDYMLNIANQTSLTVEFVESALSFYRMALHRNLTRARKIENVALDIFTLGKTFLFLARALSIQLPIVDPCLYIQRYGHRLNLGEKTHAICVTAVRLVSRMKRDWIHHGRRPAGLCGAAILVAARLHGVKRSIKQIVRVVRISSSVLLRRLKDFSNTQTALLTIDEFQDMDLSAESVESDPPAYLKSLEQSQRFKKLEKQNNWLDPEVLQQVSKTQIEIEVYMGIRQAITVGMEETQRTGTIFKKPQKITNNKSVKKYSKNNKSSYKEDEDDKNFIETKSKVKVVEKSGDEDDSDDILPSIEEQFSIIFSQDQSNTKEEPDLSENVNFDELALLNPLKKIIKQSETDEGLNTTPLSQKIFHKTTQLYPQIPDTEEINSDFDDFEIENVIIYFFAQNGSLKNNCCTCIIDHKRFSIDMVGFKI